MEKFELKKEDYDIIASKDVALNDIYEASPFDHQRNWDGELETSFFKKVFFVEPDHLKDRIDEFGSYIQSNRRKKKIIFFTGFSGTGKTTFINSYINKNPQNVEFIVIDFNEIPEDLIKDDSHPISDGIRFYITSHFIPNDESKSDWLYETINFIYEKHTSFLQLISEKSLNKIKEYINNPQKNINNNKYYLLNNLINIFDPMDLFTIFLIILFKNIPFEKKVVLVFENLDIIKLDYITKAFLDDFQKLHSNCSRLSQRINLFGRKTLFSKRFKFVFVLREATFAKNPHITDQLGVGWSQFVFTNAHSLTNQILERRKNIVNGMISFDYNFSSEEKEVNKLVEYFTNDDYFDKSIINLFNRDIKKLVRVFEEIFRIKKGHQISYVIHESDFRKYEKRGALIYWLIKYLKENEHLDDIFRLNYSRSHSVRCDHGRMILTYLLNINGFLFNKHILNSNYKSKVCSLLDLIETFCKFFNTNDLLSFIEKGYSFHQETSWVNILSVYNKNMNSKNPFKEEKQIISKYTTCKYNSKEPKNEYDNDDFDKNKSNLDKLNNIEISITPSGYSLIKFILIHFEYYSNRIRNDNESLKHPLFYLGLKKAKDGKYLFEHKIDSVLELIKKEAKDNFFFFSKIFREKNRITPEEFEESNMAFKYFSENRKSNKGCFHLTRIISSQIAYIDKFRLYLINKDSLIDMQQITNINNLLIKYIKNYLSILEKYSLDSRKSIILGEIAKQIQIIENTFDKNSGILVPNHEE